MQYLSYFIFPSQEEENDYLWEMGNTGSYYPFRVLSKNRFTKIEFAPVTILYGGNGTGKSTALNVIAEKIKADRSSAFNRSVCYQDYVDLCEIDALEQLPPESKIITSDDVFDFMLDIRSINEGITKKREELAKEFLTAKYSQFQLKSMADYEKLKRANKARSITQSKYIRSEVMGHIDGRSNGESAFRYFIEKIKENGLYLLDEPENSLSPKRQLELKSFIEESVRFFGCQFIISTHSPFLLAIDHAKIYDLDANPVIVQKWTDLENVKLYYEFLLSHEKEFREN